MKKSILAAILAAGCMFSHSNAQLKILGIGPYAELASPAGDFKESYKRGVGAGLGVDIRLGRIALTGSAGILHFSGKTVNQGASSQKMPAINAVPLRAGIKLYFARLIYLKIEGGVANTLNGENSFFILSPGIGARILGLDIQAKYETWTKEGPGSFPGLRAAYSF